MVFGQVGRHGGLRQCDEFERFERSLVPGEFFVFVVFVVFVALFIDRLIKFNRFLGDRAHTWGAVHTGQNDDQQIPPAVGQNLVGVGGGELQPSVQADRGGADVGGIGRNIGLQKIVSHRRTGRFHRIEKRRVQLFEPFEKNVDEPAARLPKKCGSVVENLKCSKFSVDATGRFIHVH